MKLPQLSLRELFLLVALAAMGCGWWVDHRRTADRDQLKNIVDKLSETVRYHADRNELSTSEAKLGEELGILPKPKQTP